MNVTAAAAATADRYPTSWWWNKARTTAHPPLPILWWRRRRRSKKELVCILSAGNSISQNCPPGFSAWKGWHGRDHNLPCPLTCGLPLIQSQGWAGKGRRWAGEGRQPWVGCTTWASLMGRQLSAWYVGMQAATAHADTRGFKTVWSRRLWNRSAPPCTASPRSPPPTVQRPSPQWKPSQRSANCSRPALRGPDWSRFHVRSFS